MLGVFALTDTQDRPLDCVSTHMFNRSECLKKVSTHVRLHCITSWSSLTCCLSVRRFLASSSRFALLPCMLCKSARFYATAALRTCLWTNLVHNSLDTFACSPVWRNFIPAYLPAGHRKTTDPSVRTQRTAFLRFYPSLPVRQPPQDHRPFRPCFPHFLRF